jgi:N-ethylmaleimide reductase
MYAHTFFNRRAAMATPDLFTPIELGALVLPNRVVMAPMTRNRAGAGNVPGALAAKYYRQRASAGLIVTEATQVSPQGVGYPGTPGIHDDLQVAGWRRVTDAVHAAGGRIFLQLWHVGRISHPSLQPGGALPVAPSAIAARGEAFTASGPQPFVIPRALETAEIPGIVAQFEHGARHALAAGFDGVEIHGANGYLIDQFLRDGTNCRTDHYGGSLENRARFLLEVTEAVAGVWDAERVGVRLSPQSGFNDMRESDPAATFGYAAQTLAPLGLAYLHVVEPVGADAAPLIADLKAAFGGPLMVNGGYTRPLAEAALARGEADLVSFGASFLANPDLPLRLAHNAPLNAPDPATFYGGDQRGYTDYPALDDALAIAS